MASKVHHSKEELQSLLELTADEVFSVLLAAPPHHDQLFFENFTTISLRAVKYLSAYLNHLTPNQQLGGAVDRLARGFAEALKEYRGRNVFVHSVHARSSDGGGEGGGEEDEIYHFLNTRNNLLPVECLSTYENDRQRRELEEFVQEMKKHEMPRKEQKHSLVLPKDNNFELKIGRKRTYDPSPLPQADERRQQQAEESVIPAPLLPLPSTEHVETQTESFIVPESQKPQQKKTEVEIPSQCISVQASEAVLNALSHNHLVLPAQQRKEKKKGLLDSDSKSKKKAKFANSSQAITKAVEPVGTSKSIGKQRKIYQQPSQCSLKLVKLNEKVLSVCSREVDLIVSNAEEIVITINYTPSDKQLAPYTHSSAIILDEGSGSSYSQSTAQKIQIQQQQRLPSGKLIVSGYTEESKNLLSTGQNDRHEASMEGGPAEGKKKYAIMKSAKLIVKQMQRLPISTVKIAEYKENEEKIAFPKQMRLKHTESVLISEEKAKVTMKRKKFTGERQLFQSFILSETESESNFSQHLRSSKVNVDFLESLLKKESGLSENSPKFPSFAKNQAESLSSSLSQDYLVSREKSDPQQLVNRLIDLEKQAQGEERKAEERDSRHRDTPTFNRKTSNFSSDASHVQPVGKIGQMIRISNAHRLTEDLGNKLRMEHSKFYENHKISTDTEKEKEKFSDAKQPLPKHSFLKKNHLSLIPQNQRPEFSDSTFLNKSSLDDVSRSDCRIIPSPESHSGPYKSIFYRQSTEMLPVRVPMGKLKEEARWQSGPKAISKHKQGISSSVHSSITEVEGLKRKLRNLGYKDKLGHYLELIEATHLQFCGPNCEHLRDLFSGKEGSVAEQIIRLFKRLK